MGAERNHVHLRSSVPLFPTDPLRISAAQRFWLFGLLHLSGENLLFLPRKKKKKVLSFPRNRGRQALCNFCKLNRTSPFLIRHKLFRASSPTAPLFLPSHSFFLQPSILTANEIHHFICRKNIIEDVSSTTQDSISKDIDYIPP